MEVAMSRRSTPERLHEARRAATIERLVGDGELRERAERLVALWEAQADVDGVERDCRYWEAGWTWISIQRAGRAAAGLAVTDSGHAERRAKPAA
jgi:hypothetical protein